MQIAVIAVWAALSSKAATLPAGTRKPNQETLSLGQLESDFSSPVIGAVPQAFIVPADQTLQPPPDPFPSGFWESLPSPDVATLTWLKTRLPQAPVNMIRLVPLDQAVKMMDKAAALNYSSLDLCTLETLKEGKYYLLTQDVLSKLIKLYDLSMPTAVSGQTHDGDPFMMQALVLGGGHVEVLYDQDNFRYNNPDYPDHDFIAASRVSQTIMGPADLSADGLMAHSWLGDFRLIRFTRISATKIRVTLRSGDDPSSDFTQTEDLFPLRRLSP